MQRNNPHIQSIRESSELVSARRTNRDLKKPEPWRDSNPDRGPVTIPRIIWGLWLNFGQKSDGVLDETLQFFYDRILYYHQNWDMRIITEWDRLERELSQAGEDEKWMRDVLNNPHIGGAHKSDMIRFFLLKKYGGVWIDMSTFLFVKLDSYIRRMEATGSDFHSQYISATTAATMILALFGRMYDKIDMRSRQEFMRRDGRNMAKLRMLYKHFPWVPENYFIISTANQPIIADVFGQMRAFWTDAEPRIVSKQTMCFELNKYIDELMRQYFRIRFLIPKQDNTDLEIWRVEEMYDCGYLFNYMQLYAASERNVVRNSKQIVRDRSVYSTINKWGFGCDEKLPDDARINTCDNFTYLLRNGNHAMFESSAFNRNFKWSDTLEERISFRNTYLGDLLNGIETQEEAEKILIQLRTEGLRFIKFGSWSRKSPIVQTLKRWYTKSID